MFHRISFIALSLALAATAANAQGIIQSGSTYLQFAGTPFSTGTGNANLLFGSTSAFGTDALYRDGWSYNQGVGTSNRPFSSLDTPTQSYVGNVATFTWTNAGAGSSGFARWDAVMTITLQQVAPSPNSSTPGKAVVNTTLTFKSNASNSGNISFNLFNDLDFDIAGSSANNATGDTYRVIDSSTASGIRANAFDASGPNFVDAVGVGAQRYEFNTGSALRSKLGETSGTGSGNLSFAAGTNAADWASTDGAMAFQWLRTLAPGQSFTLQSNFAVNTPVPEPATGAMFAVGALALGAVLRRRRR
jgi:hypothetical protein